MPNPLEAIFGPAFATRHEVPPKPVETLVGVNGHDHTEEAGEQLHPVKEPEPFVAVVPEKVRYDHSAHMKAVWAKRKAKR